MLLQFLIFQCLLHPVKDSTGADDALLTPLSEALNKDTSVVS